MLDSTWVLNFRSELLTNLFLLSPPLTGGMFYILVITMGYWLSPGNVLFRQLGFLLPFASLTNIILKNIFSIARKSESLYLVEIEDLFGFPSNDVQIGVIFWCLIYINTTINLIKNISVIAILFIIIARLYLGVSTITDIMGGVFFSILILSIWQSEAVQDYIYNWSELDLKKIYTTFWSLSGTLIIIYLITVDRNLFSVKFVVSAGALIGFGLSLKDIKEWQYIPNMYGVYHLASVLLSCVMLVALSKIIPTINYSDVTAVISGILECALLAFMIFSVMPRLQKFITLNYDQV